MDKIEGEQPKCHFTKNEGDAGNLKPILALESRRQGTECAVSVRFNTLAVQPFHHITVSFNSLRRRNCNSRCYLKKKKPFVILYLLIDNHICLHLRQFHILKLRLFMC
jgi:hypothetical protein